MEISEEFAHSTVECSPPMIQEPDPANVQLEEGRSDQQRLEANIKLYQQPILGQCLLTSIKQNNRFQTCHLSLIDVHLLEWSNDFIKNTPN